METKYKYRLEPHYSNLKNTFHYHLILTKEDTRGIKFFYSINEIINANLNEELQKLMIKALHSGVKYIKVEVKEL